jgi:hypothetical protein
VVHNMGGKPLEKAICSSTSDKFECILLYADDSALPSESVTHLLSMEEIFHNQ